MKKPFAGSDVMAIKDTRIFVRLPRDVHGKFQSVCEARGITMSDAVRAMIEKEISK